MSTAAPALHTVVKHYDPLLGMNSETINGTREEIHALVLDDLAWAEGLIEGNEFPGTVTLNTDRVDNPTAYFLVWHNTDGTIQADTFVFAD